MKNSKPFNSPKNQSRFYKIFKRKIFFSNEVKKALLIAFYEARSFETYINMDLLLYGLISQQKSLSGRLILLTYSQYLNNKNLTLKTISSRIQKINQENFKEKFRNTDFINENKNTPCLSPEVKKILALAVKSALQSKKQIVVVKTKDILFSLLANENIRNLLRSLVN